MSKLPFPEFPVVIVDDEEISLHSISIVLKTTGFTNLRCFVKSAQALRFLEDNPVSLLMLDMLMPEISGQEILSHVHAEYPDLPIIIITGMHELETAVDCMKNGAFDYLLKPVKKERLQACIKRAYQYREMQLENIAIKQSIFTNALRNPEAFADMLTCNDKMKIIFQYIEAIAGSSEVILITGETGVGKGLMAEAIHRVSGRQGKFIKANIAGIDDTFFADTLFGHTRGAYTGADIPRKGLIEQATGGTLFLDEIGDLPASSQIKLLRLVEDREYLPLGADLVKRTDTRIITATNQDLRAMVQDGSFRKDLFYRLNIHNIHVPPLRDRLNDLPLLIDHFLEQAARELNKKKPAVPGELFTLMSLYTYPGNIRELRGMVMQALSQHKNGMLSTNYFRNSILDKDNQPEVNDRGHFFSSVLKSSPGRPLPTLKEAENLLIERALELSDNNQSLAAKLLGITRQALNYHIKKRRNWSLKIL